MPLQWHADSCSRQDKEKTHDSYAITMLQLLVAVFQIKLSI